tara:strand:+ start:203 stop:382 length:180 start_codon:yes stop_codon:yes gene_type:complete
MNRLQETILEKKRLGNIAIKDALQYWDNNKNGVYRNESDKQFSSEYCDMQIDYFKKLKL